MPVAPVLILFIAIVAANLAVMAIILVPPMVGRTSPLARDVVPGVDAERRAAEAAIVGGIEGSVTDDGVSTRTYDRVVRVVSWVFLLTTSVIVAATGLWPETQPAIFVLLAFAGLFIVVVHELLPPDTLGPAKFVVEGSVAITVATLLVALTGGGASPFFFAFPLIVGGAALVVSPSITVGLAAAASIGYILAVLVGSAIRDSRSGDGGHGRGQPDGPDPPVVRGDGHRSGAAPDARRGHPPVDGRLADRALQPRPSSSPRSSARSPAARARAAASAC